jgi:hypothetical protein
VQETKNMNRQVMLLSGQEGFSKRELKGDELILTFPEKKEEPKTFQKEVKKKFAKKNLGKK